MFLCHLGLISAHLILCKPARVCASAITFDLTTAAVNVCKRETTRACAEAPSEGQAVQTADIASNLA